MTRFSTDPDWSSVVLALPLDGANNATTFTDLKGKTVTPAGDAKISTTQSKFGGSSAYFDGTGDYLGIPSSTDFDLADTYTIEFWVYPNSTSSNFGVVHRGYYETGSNSWTGLAFSIRWLGSGARFYFYATTNANEQVINVPNAFAANTWKHVAMVRNGTTGTVFIDGVLSGTITGLNSCAASSRVTQVGVWEYSSGAEYFNGYIDDLRITKGVARYASDFTPPASIMSLMRELALEPVDLPYAYIALQRALIDLPYLGAPTLKGLGDLPYASRLRPRSQIDLVYQHQPVSRAVANLPYGSLVGVVAVAACPYLFGAGTGPIIQQTDITYRVTDNQTVIGQADLPYWGDASPAVVVPSSACTIGGVAIDPLAIDLTWSRDQYTISATVTLEDAADYALARVGTPIVLTLYGTDYHLQVESRQRQRSHGEWAYTVSCLSPAAWLDAPYSATINGAQTGLASVVASTLAGTIPLTWATVDWTLAAGDLFATDQTQLALIRQLAAAPGGVLLSLPDGSLVVEPAYPVAVNLWPQAAPSAVIRESMDVISSGETDDHRPGYNIYLITDQVSSADSLRIDSESESELVYLLRIYQTPWVNDFDFRHTGGDWVQLEDLGIEERQVEEVVEFIAGEGRVQFPIYALASAEWKQVNLGSVSFVEEGTLTSSTEGESLLAITYTTRCRRYRARDSRSEQVQFVAEVIA
jgi:hypothetical protein